MAKQPKKSNNRSYILLLLIAVIIGISVLWWAMSSISTAVENADSATIAFVPVYGTIVSESSAGFFAGSSETSSSQFIQTMEQIADDPTIDGVLIQINSGGGYPVPSHKMSQAINQLNKPVVILIEDTAASGAYFIASAGDHIVADNFSLVGGIGVYGSMLNVAELIDNYNITYERLVAGKYKDLGTPFKELTNEERALLQDVINKMYDGFVRSVASNRNLDEEYVRSLSTGQVYLGNDALNLGLIDEIGTTKQAEQFLLEKINASQIQYVSFEKTPSFFETIFSLKSHNPLKILSDQSPTFS